MTLRIHRRQKGWGQVLINGSGLMRVKGEDIGRQNIFGWIFILELVLLCVIIKAVPTSWPDLSSVYLLHISKWVSTCTAEFNMQIKITFLCNSDLQSSLIATFIFLTAQFKNSIILPAVALKSMLLYSLSPCPLGFLF